MNRNIATVAVEKTFFSIDSDFDYYIKPEQLNLIKIGSRVKVPFGNGNKLREGIVVNIFSATVSRPQNIPAQNNLGIIMDGSLPVSETAP